MCLIEQCLCLVSTAEERLSFVYWSNKGEAVLCAW